MTHESRTCQNCKNAFAIQPEDFSFYEKMKVPPPTWCPQCRLIRRLVWRNERALYHRTCSLCEQSIIAMYPEDAPFPVYCKDCWFSDKWDATKYGRDYDFSRPFFSQFRDLLNAVPQIALQATSSPGSDYVNQVTNCKNCYLITSGNDNEECMYCYRVLNSKNTLDSIFIRNVEYSYQCSQSTIVSNSLFCDDCADSTNLYFCSDVRGSSECFMSSNLRMRSYVFRNKQLTADEFAQEMKKIDMGSYAKLEAYRAEYRELCNTRLYTYMSEKNTSQCTGHGLINSSNCKHCFYSSNSENCKYLLMLADIKDGYDINNGCCIMELAYELSTAGVNLYNVMFSADVWPDVRDTAYSQSCRNDASNLFGCVSLRKKQYCILNKQYTKSEYEVLRTKIVSHMNDMPYTDARGRTFSYGEFFPPELSLYAYNETPAQDYFPKNKSEAESSGFRWKELPKRRHEITIHAQDLPDHINDAPDSITKEIIGCLHGGDCEHQCPAAFRITSQELTIYRKYNLALPRLCPNCRHYERFSHTNSYRLWEGRCHCGGAKSIRGNRINFIMHSHGNSHCENTFETSYAPDSPTTVYCQDCYQKEIV